MTRKHGVLADRAAIVTGAAQGMGAAIARRFAEEGAAVTVADIHRQKAEDVADSIRTAGGQASAWAVDVTVEREVEDMVRAVAARHGGVSLLVNNAGVLRATRVEEISTEEWDLVLNVNLKATFFCTRAVLPMMKKNRFGRIINMSSSAGRSVSTLGGAHYTTAKAAVLGFTRAVAKETAPFGITCNAICPGLIDTEMVRANCPPERLQAYERSFPVPRLGTPEEVADLALYLAAHAPYVTGASIDINGGDLMM